MKDDQGQTMMPFGKINPREVLRTPLAALTPPDEMIGLTLMRMIREALAFFTKTYPDYPFQPEKGLMAQLEDLALREADGGKKQEILVLVKELQVYFRLPDPNDAQSSCGKVCLFSAHNHQVLYLMMTPPRGLGNVPTEGVIATALKRANIRLGHDLPMIHQALERVRGSNDIIWGLVLDEGCPAVSAQLKVDFQVSVIDKQELMQDVQKLADWLTPWWKPVSKGQLIGRTRVVDPGKPGKNIFGKIVPVATPELKLSFGEEAVSLSAQGELMAKSAGYVVKDKDRLEIAPFYVMENPPPGSVNDFSFAGSVLVLGDLQGPGSLECEDLYVLGNCEQMNIVAQGDVFVAGGLVGHQQTKIEADGRIYASFVSEAELSALNEIVAVNAILNSQLTSNTLVRVTSPKGLIAGGRICSLMDISAATIGSEFGFLTEAVVGKDFLTQLRLEDIARKMALHESNLSRIQDLKRQLVSAHIPVEKMAPDKQEIYLNILRKEQNSEEELKSSLRRKKTLMLGLQQVLSATISVLDKLYPPVRVQIGDVIREIQERLETVSLYYDQMQGGIVSNPLNKKEGES